MLARIVEASLQYKFLVLVAALLLVVLGVRAVTRIPVDAFPDVTPVQVQIFTESPGLSPEEVEKIITVPVESAMAGLPRVELIRSLSLFGLSFVTVFFEDGTDVFFARQRVFERLAEAKERIPEGFGTPLMGPNTTGLGQVFQYYLKSPGPADLADGSPRAYRTGRSGSCFAPRPAWTISSRSAATNASTRCRSTRPASSSTASRSPTSLPRIAAGNKAVGGQFLVRNREEYLVRGSGWAQSVEDLQRIVLKEEKGTPVLLRDVAQVVQGPALRRGAVTRNGEEVVTGHRAQAERREHQAGHRERQDQARGRPEGACRPASPSSRSTIRPSSSTRRSGPPSARSWRAASWSSSSCSSSSARSAPRWSSCRRSRSRC